MTIKFNPQQLQVIEHKEGPISVIAGAGSGKSTVLVHRIKKLIENGVSQNEIVAITFTRNSANDLKKKLNSLGILDVNVGTFHSVLSKMLLENGIDVYKKVPTFEIRKRFNAVNFNSDLDDILSFISYQKCYMRGYNDVFVAKESAYVDYELSKYYQIYENLKKEKNAYDFDDYLLEALKILRVNPNAFKCKYLLVDEHQDNNMVQNLLMKEMCPSGNIMVVGDYRQCLIPTTKIQTVEGEKEIKNITTNDKLIVGAGRGTVATINPEEIMKKHYEGKIIKITTKSGKIIECTPNHGIFANRLIKKPYVVYLMYRPDYGFRIGQSSNYTTKNKKNKNGFEHRLTTECGEKIWAIKTCETKEEACYYENYFAFEYGLPLYVFNVKSRNVMLNQEKIKKLFNNIDTYNRGMKLLNDLNLFFDMPHYIPEGNSQHINVRISMNMFGSNKKNAGTNSEFVGYNHELSFNTINEKFSEKAKEILNGCVNLKTNKQGFKFFNGRKSNGYHDQLMEQAYKLEDLDKKNKLIVKATLSNTCDKMELYPASNIREGMEIAMYNGSSIENELVVKIETYDYFGTVYDINVPHYRNYIANNIVTHNCIYAFRGAEPRYFMNFHKDYPNAKVVNLDNNYRSGSEIIDNANNFIRNYYGGYEHYSDSIATSDIKGKTTVEIYETAEDEAEDIANAIQNMLCSGVMPKDIAVLYRLNSMPHQLEMSLIKRNIPYHIENDNNFFKSKQLVPIISCLRLLEDNNDDEAFLDLLQTRCYPFTYVPKVATRQIEEYAFQHGISYLEASVNAPIGDKQVQTFIGFKNMLSSLKKQYHQNDSALFMSEKIIFALKLQAYIEQTWTGEEIERRKNSVKSFLLFTENATVKNFLKFVQNGKRTAKKSDENAVQLMTIHKSKGLEWNNVFVMGLQEGKFPSKKAKLEEEARLFYVAITRPKNKLFISQLGQYNTFCNQYKGLNIDKTKMKNI